MTEVPVRDAATVILLRDLPDKPRVLMGQRGSSMAFMPNKFVFPGGRVDEQDYSIELAADLMAPCRDRLAQDARDGGPQAMAACALRELWEETGQILGQKADWTDAPADWAGFASAGYRPSAAGLKFFFRAITPPGRPRRFDARFFLASAEDLVTDADDFAAAQGELSHLSWVPLDEARALDLPFITSVVLGELDQVTKVGPPDSVPFFKNTDEANLFLRIRDRA